MRLPASLLVIVFSVVSISAQTLRPQARVGSCSPSTSTPHSRRAASTTEPEPPPPPVEATLSRIDYNLKIDGDLATGEARLTVDVIKNGWVRVPMPEGLIVRDAQLDGRPVTLVTRPKDKGPGALDLLLSKPGRSVLTLKIVAPVTTVAGTDILHLPVSNSAISHANVELMRQGVDVRVTGGLLLEHSEAPTGSHWKANGKGGEPLTFRVAPTRRRRTRQSTASSARRSHAIGWSRRRRNAGERRSPARSGVRGWRARLWSNCPRISQSTRFPARWSPIGT